MILSFLSTSLALEASTSSSKTFFSSSITASLDMAASFSFLALSNSFTALIVLEGTGATSCRGDPRRGVGRLVPNDMNPIVKALAIAATVI